MDAEALALLVAASLNAGTSLALAGLGLLINERAGVVNLGAEGLLLMAAVTGFATAAHTGSDVLALLAAMGCGGLVACAFGVIVIWLSLNQYAAGLALSLFCAGLSAFVGQPYTQAALTARQSFAIPVLSQLPLLGPALFRQHPLTYASFGIAIALWWLLSRTRVGLVLRAVGESPESAHALGYPVRRIRLLALGASGCLCGLAGGYLSVVYTPLWVEGMVAGKGWIALALTAFATWRPLRVLFGAYLFGGVTMLQFHLQAQGLAIASQWLSMLPYLSTVLVLVLISRDRRSLRVNVPAALGKPFVPEA
jgi:simple sugar transport system permease protein